MGPIMETIHWPSLIIMVTVLVCNELVLPIMLTRLRATIDHNVKAPFGVNREQAVKTHDGLKTYRRFRWIVSSAVIVWTAWMNRYLIMELLTWVISAIILVIVLAVMAPFMGLTIGGGAGSGCRSVPSDGSMSHGEFYGSPAVYNGMAPSGCRRAFKNNKTGEVVFTHDPDMSPGRGWKRIEIGSGEPDTGVQAHFNPDHPRFI
jgi:hypothetical protein